MVLVCRLTGHKPLAKGLGAISRGPYGYKVENKEQQNPLGAKFISVTMKGEESEGGYARKPRPIMRKGQKRSCK